MTLADYYLLPSTYSFGPCRLGVFHPRAREETPESRGMPCLFLNTERGFGGKPPQKSGFRRHLAGSKMPKEGSKMPKETFFTAISRWRVVSRRAWSRGALDASGFDTKATLDRRPAAPRPHLEARRCLHPPPSDSWRNFAGSPAGVASRGSGRSAVSQSAAGPHPPRIWSASRCARVGNVKLRAKRSKFRSTETLY